MQFISRLELGGGDGGRRGLRGREGAGRERGRGALETCDERRREGEDERVEMVAEYEITSICTDFRIRVIKERCADASSDGEVTAVDVVGEREACNVQGEGGRGF